MKHNGANLQRRLGPAAVLAFPRRSASLLSPTIGSPASSSSSIANFSTYPSPAQLFPPSASETTQSRRSARMAVLVATVAGLLLLNSTINTPFVPTLHADTETTRVTGAAISLPEDATTKDELKTESYGRQLLEATKRSNKGLNISAGTTLTSSSSVDRKPVEANASAKSHYSAEHSKEENVKRASSQLPANTVEDSRATGEGGRPAIIAFFLQISNSSISLLPRLLERLHHPQNVYGVHFDSKIDHQIVEAFKKRVASESRFSNVHVLPSELITYRGISMLLNTINAMNALLDFGDWDYFVNLSGADYPLLDIGTQRALLGHRLGMNFFTFAPRRTWNKMAENRLSELWFDEGLSFRANASLGRLQKLAVRNPLVDARAFEVVHSEAWCVLSRDFVRHILSDDEARKMLLAFSYAVDASEHYFASVAWNSNKFKSSIVPHSMRMIMWLRDGVIAGQHPYFVDDKAPDGTYVFEKDIKEAVLMYARKFRTPDSDLMGQIDERATKRATVDAARGHFERKVASREARVMEL